MNEESMQSTLSTLKEMVLDEQKLVTYLSLSKDLCIHVNESKILLAKLIEDLGPKLNVSFIISGLCDDHKARTTVSSGDDIDSVRKSFKIIFYEHIYSVNKGISTVDKVAFLAVNKFEDFPLCTGLIKSDVCLKRTAAEIGNLKSNSQQSIDCNEKPVQGPSKKVKQEKKDTEPLLSNGLFEIKTVAKVQVSKSEPNMKTEKISPKKESGSIIKQSSTIKKSNGKSQKGITGFFYKSNSVPSKQIEKVVEKQEPIIKRERTLEEIPKPETNEVMEVDEMPVVKDVQIKKERNGKSKESLNQIKKTAKVDKKRKRVLHVSDSESEGEKDPFEDEPEVKIDDGSEDKIPPTPTIATVKITSGIINPKKKRKMVDKTYTGEDGYILTRKEEVYESCSDSEVKEEIKENIQKPKINQTKQDTSPPEKKQNAKSKKKSPKNGAQSIMNFFKKV